MAIGWLEKLWPSAGERQLRRLRKTVAQIGQWERDWKEKPDADLRACISRLKEDASLATQQLGADLNRDAINRILEPMVVPAFALVRIAAFRTLDQRPFDVQVLGGLALHQGLIAEMKTGEGKTLVATMPAVLNALCGRGVHIVTVNDYLARRDSSWMGPIYELLGLRVGTIVADLTDEQRKSAYQADITYGTNNEFGFDYLRDNIRYRLNDMVQRPYHFAIVDEVDSILIDEARTPLIISGPSDSDSQLVEAVAPLVDGLDDQHLDIDEKTRRVQLSEGGSGEMEQRLRAAGLLSPEDDLYSLGNTNLFHHVMQGLRAQYLYRINVHYIVRAGEVVIIDEFSGRMSLGRRFSDGLHQAIEAKERVAVLPENRTMASVTFQNYFRMYPKLGGMTGTAQTEAEEFSSIYRLSVVSVPTNKPMIRIDHNDAVFRTKEARNKSVIETIKDRYDRGQPVLVGTISIEKSEELSKELSRIGVQHAVLNARNVEKEAQIISNAGMFQTVTISTNMAGRGTDIALGGHLETRVLQHIGERDVDDDERARIRAQVQEAITADRNKVLQVGGLCVIGVERHESRRVDNQLRGRAGRQGDPGESHFFISLEDDLVRVFGSEKLDGMLAKLGMTEDESIEHAWINTALERAQRKVEAHNFDIRKQLLQFDDVLNQQRRATFDQRRELMGATDVRPLIEEIVDGEAEQVVKAGMPSDLLPAQWDVEAFERSIKEQFGLSLPVRSWLDEDDITEEEVARRVKAAHRDQMVKNMLSLRGEDTNEAHRMIMLQILDGSWRDHLTALEHLRQGIGFRAYAQRDPLNEYKREAFALYQVMLNEFSTRSIRLLSRMKAQTPDQMAAGSLSGVVESQAQLASLFNSETNAVPPDQSAHNAWPEDSASSEPLLGGDGAAVVAPSRRQRARGQSATTTVRHRPMRADDPSTWVHTPRNAPCPCGSGRKYKHCHGKVASSRSPSSSTPINSPPSSSRH